jgi:cytoskeletal protein CcmA (bactofilin family)
VGFWNNSKDSESKAEKEAGKVDSAASNPKNPTVLAVEEKLATQEKSKIETSGSPSDKTEASPLSKSEQGLIDRYGIIRSALGKGTVIQGKLSFDTPVRIDGSLNGDVYSSQVLIVGESGVIEADIEVSSLIVMGKVKGKIKARERIELWSGGVLEGEIDCPAFVMEENSQFDGTCTMGSKASTQKIDKQEVSTQKKQESKAAAKSEDSKEVRVH